MSYNPATAGNVHNPFHAEGDALKRAGHTEKPADDPETDPDVIARQLAHIIRIQAATSRE